MRALGQVHSERVGEEKYNRHYEHAQNGSAMIEGVEQPKKLGHHDQGRQEQRREGIGEAASITAQDTYLKETHRQLMEVKSIRAVGGRRELHTPPNSQDRIRDRPEENEQDREGTKPRNLI